MAMPLSRPCPERPDSRNPNAEPYAQDPARTQFLSGRTLVLHTHESSAGLQSCSQGIRKGNVMLRQMSRFVDASRSPASRISRPRLSQPPGACRSVSRGAAHRRRWRRTDRRVISVENGNITRSGRRANDRAAGAGTHRSHRQAVMPTDQRAHQVPARLTLQRRQPDPGKYHGRSESRAVFRRGGRPVAGH
jgi:hypothetical protein